jgi:hypothetical protein
MCVERLVRTLGWGAADRGPKKSKAEALLRSPRLSRRRPVRASGARHVPPKTWTASGGACLAPNIVRRGLLSLLMGEVSRLARPCHYVAAADTGRLWPEWHRTDSEKRVELLHREASLANDGSNRSRFQVPGGVNRHGDGSGPILREYHNMVAADHPLDHKARTPERPDDAPAVDGRQPAASHLKPGRSRGGFQAVHQMECPGHVRGGNPGRREWLLPH